MASKENDLFPIEPYTTEPRTVLTRSSRLIFRRLITAFRLLPVSCVMRALASLRAEVSGDKSARYVFHRRIYPQRQRRMLHFRVIYFDLPSTSRVIRT